MKRWRQGMLARAAWGLLAQDIGLSGIRLVNYWLIVYKSDLLISIFSISRMHTGKKISGRNNTRLNALLWDVRALRKGGRSTRRAAKHFQFPFPILAINCDRIREADVKSKSPIVSLNRGYIFFTFADRESQYIYRFADRVSQYIYLLLTVHFSIFIVLLTVHVSIFMVLLTVHFNIFMVLLTVHLSIVIVLLTVHLSIFMVLLTVYLSIFIFC